MLPHRFQDLITLFNSQFFVSHQTLLISGVHEPIYLPRDEYCPFDRIVFAHGFFTSALHEIAHWCIAGKRRRQQVDYGYWYEPDGRNEMTQQQFETVEVAPQALDWLFCLATKHVFHVSCDNLNGNFVPDRLAFKQQVKYQVVKYLNEGVPPRAALFLQQLHRAYKTVSLTEDLFLKRVE